MKDNKTLDLICLGRAAVDLYGKQVGSRLEDMSSFAKYLGGRRAISPMAPLAWDLKRRC